jgi:hypothetical protein
MQNAFSQRFMTLTFILGAGSNFTDRCYDPRRLADSRSVTVKRRIRDSGS